MKKKQAILITTVALLISLLVPFFSSCGVYNPPPLSDVYERLVYLIEGSQDVNTFLFGEGLPVYEVGSEYADVNMIYYGMSNPADAYVSTHAKFLTIEDMKDASARYYGSEYLAAVSDTCFVGVASGDTVLPARYSDNGKWLSQSLSVKPLIHGRRVYDYATMEIVKPSSNQYLFVSIESYTEEHPDQRVVFTLSFVWENDNWYLNAPSY